MANDATPAPGAQPPHPENQRSAQEKAWDEGYFAGIADGDWLTANPYRAETIAIPWYMRHSSATGHATVDEYDRGARCLECPALPPSAGLVIPRGEGEA